MGVLIDAEYSGELVTDGSENIKCGAVQVVERVVGAVGASAEKRRKGRTMRHNTLWLCKQPIFYSNRFFKDEPTALVQSDGGPCAVLAPVQAFIFKSLLTDKSGINWKEVCDKVVSFANVEEVEEFYIQQIETLQNTFGVLLLLYSVLCTKGLEQVREEMSDPMEPLIDGTYGYGSQSLINLILTGKAVGHVWNYDQNVGGLKLRGVDHQCEVGFLTLLEHLRYCEVGSFLKNPKHPIWVLASETHLTVLFSLEKQLVRPETPSEVAQRVFKSFDPEGNNFISSLLLQDVLKALDLVSETEYVEIMAKKLDSESLGIILLNAFMEEFFPDEKPTIPEVFTVFHYNGLPRSCPENKVMYQEGNAVLLECDMKSVLDNNPMLTCLQTKWPNIEIQWRSGSTPSLN
uniref:Ubiquitin carboxyl-terminal hydrolase MINDY n=1 Tax=Timema bartmani TaxID=61472 RepID=A0A7R9ELS2_9NEOP|nr:unnamed protein product [Timema bartmani]